MKPRRWIVASLGYLLGSRAVLGQSNDIPSGDDIERARDHVVMVEDDGSFRDPAKMWQVGDVRGGDGLPSLKTQLDRIEEKLKAMALKHKPLKVLVFVHGGMVTYTESYTTYKTFLPRMCAAGYYPIFIVWNSGWMTTYIDHLVRVRQGVVQEDKTLGYLTAPFIFSADVLTAVARAPVVWGREATNDLLTTEFPNGKQAANHGTVEKYIQSRCPGHFVTGEDRRSDQERMIYGTSYALTSPFKYFLASPIIDGLGTKAWDNMLRRTKTMFDPYPRAQEVYTNIASKTSPEAQQKALESWFDKKPGIMREFSDRLCIWSNSSELHMQLELYGHSMGTIVLNNMLESSPDIHASRIVYMAAACSMRDWERSIWPYMAGSGTGAKFYSLSINRLREESERNPVIGRWNSDLAPRGSLLNWIDGFLENPKTSEDRTLGSWVNLTQIVPQIPKNLMDRMYFHCFDAVTTDAASPPPQPQSHSEIVSWDFWQDDYLFPKSNADVPPRIPVEIRPLIKSG